ncbi:hypothetical protein Kfla_5958 [Kribbella flavida DSM 17836]|uniref:Integral membrane protein n=1 Tax=Kribbella flavida (strain DSM 17836 / JCM 10339 / NBRC 14399) TaxID=479435 RepID=D2PRP4_KRIFD|nr:hypothetical protein [Kribbella flavida]ADB34962.1 hypothetical protein Kfla_5958 [Kribbella flavida DSM 17836]
MTAIEQPALRPAEAKRPRATLWLLRLVLLWHAALVIAQPILAGYFLSGESDAIALHSPIGSTLWMVAALQFVAAVLYWRPGGGRLWPALVTLALFFADFVQLVFGHQQNFTVHVPLGTAIVTTVVLMTVWSFRAGARRGRHPEVVR